MLDVSSENISLPNLPEQATSIVPEVEIYLSLLVIIFLIDNKCLEPVCFLYFHFISLYFY